MMARGWDLELGVILEFYLFAKFRLLIQSALVTETWSRNFISHLMLNNVCPLHRKKSLHWEWKHKWVTPWAPIKWGGPIKLWYVQTAINSSSSIRKSNESRCKKTSGQHGDPQHLGSSRTPNIIHILPSSSKEHRGQHQPSKESFISWQSFKIKFARANNRLGRPPDATGAIGTMGITQITWHDKKATSEQNMKWS